MRLTLDSATMDNLLTIIRDGGIVLYNGYFLADFSADVYAKNKGVWVDCAVEHRGDVYYNANIMPSWGLHHFSAAHQLGAVNAPKWGGYRGMAFSFSTHAPIHTKLFRN